MRQALIISMLLVVSAQTLPGAALATHTHKQPTRTPLIGETSAGKAEGESGLQTETLK